VSSVSRLKGWLRNAALMLLATAVVFLLLEGLASTGFFIHRLATRSQPPLAERNHTEYDPEIGWISKPGVTLKNLYGPGLHLHTNSQGFRAAHEYSREVPPGKIRIVCTGDSFALGYGVGDDETLCARLGALDGRFETVNMGQGGYGVDQAYLWYMRDGGVIEHDLLLFTFIYGDFLRMVDDSFLGYGKPRLAIENGEVVVHNVPVPRRGYMLPWFTQNSDLLDEMRSFAALRGLLRYFTGDDESSEGLGGSVEVAFSLFDGLAAHHRRQGSTLVLVYLPVEEDHTGNYDGFRALLARWASARRIHLIDPTEQFQSLPESQALQLFISEGPSEFPDAAGHYNARGNQWIAERIGHDLRELPEVSARLSEGVGETAK